MSEAAVRAAFAFQAECARRLGSAFTERLLAALALAIDLLAATHGAPPEPVG